MTTIRIYVEHDGPLDGASPLHPESTSAWNEALGLLEIWSPPHAPLGRLDLAPLISDGRGSEHWVEHLTVLSHSGRHQQHATVGLAPPVLTGITPEHPRALPLVDLGVCEEMASGVLTEGLGVPIPTDHALVFDTRANGKTSGPHLIQLTLGRVPRLLQGFVPTMRPGPSSPSNDGTARSGSGSEPLITFDGGRLSVSTQVPPESPESEQSSEQSSEPEGSSS